MENNAPVVLAGNSLSVMVAATGLAKKGIHVVIINGSKNWGGHFTTVAVNGVLFDIGMVLYEFTSFKNQNLNHAAITTYNPLVRNDSGRFCSEVGQFVSQYQTTHAIDTPKMLVDGKVYDDILIANSLASLPQLPFASDMINELEVILNHSQSSPLHASLKNKSDDFKTISYASASLANHGKTLHDKLIEPYCQKLLGSSSNEVIALYHRVPWLPLFYPETLLSFLQDKPQALPATIFSYPDNECVGELANKLKVEILGQPLITVINEPVKNVILKTDGQCEIAFAKQEKIITNQMAWSNSLGDLLRVLGQEAAIKNYDKCSVALAFLLIPTDYLTMDFTVLSVVDLGCVIYRITNQSRCSGAKGTNSHIVVELNAGFLANFEKQGNHRTIESHVILELIALGIIKKESDVEYAEVKVMNNSLMLPNTQNYHAFLAEMASVLAIAPGIALLGPASGFFSSSMNDQIVQGLKLITLWNAPNEN